MIDKEKREFKDGVISIFKRFNILDHTATIGSLRDDILRYIDSLQEEPVELKEVDLEKEIDDWYNNEASEEFEYVLYRDIENCAKHFFELGMRASNPITAADRGIADEIIFALNALGEEMMVSYDKEIEWIMNKVKEGE